MSSFELPDGAADEIKAELSGAFNESPEANEPQAVETPSDVEGTTADAADSAPQDEAWNLDINSLPDDIKPFAKSLQADYTRKTQALAEERRLYEGFGDAESVQQAISLAQALQSDPAGTLANLERGLQEMGLLEAAAPQPQGIQEAPQSTGDPLFDQLRETYGDGDPLVQLAQTMHSELADLKADRQSFREQLAAQEQARAEQQQEEYFRNTEQALRSNHSDWDDEDIDAIYDLVFSTGGDLNEAAERYDAMISRGITRYLQRKGGLPAGASTVPASGPGQPDAERAVNLQQATDLAKAEIEALINQGELDFFGHED